MSDYTAVIASLAVVGSSLLILLLIRVGLRLGVGMCTSGASMKGRTVIVTGANAGIGFETALELTARGARVILACRNETRGLGARDHILGRVPGGDVVFRHLDLASLASVRRFVAETLASEWRLDVLINNAGVFDVGNRHTADGIVEEMQVNHFSPFLLTLLLLPLLHRSEGRVVNVSSLMHYLGSVDLARMNCEGYYNAVRVYANNKLCNVVFTVALARRLRARGSRVTVNCLHPGTVHTELVDSSSLIKKLLFRFLCWMCVRSAREAAQTSVQLAVGQELREVSGEYFADCGRRPMLPCARSLHLGDELWRYSESLVQYNFDDVELNNVSDNDAMLFDLNKEKIL